MALIPALNQLRQRKMVEWTLAYLAGAWLLMQFVEVVAGRWPVPVVLQRAVDLLLFVGFFAAITLAWYHGEKGRQHVTGPELIILAILLFIAGALLSLLRTTDEPVGAVRTEAFEPTITVASAPFSSIPVCSSSSMTPFGVQERSVGRRNANRPMLYG